MNVLAVFGLTAFDSVEIVNIEYDTNDSVVFRWNHDGEPSRLHKSRIRYDKDGRAYFRTYKLKIALDECMRV